MRHNIYGRTSYADSSRSESVRGFGSNDPFSTSTRRSTGTSSARADTTVTHRQRTHRFSSSDDDDDFPRPRIIRDGTFEYELVDHIPSARELAPGRRRQAVRRSDGTVRTYEEFIEPEDVRAHSESHAQIIQAYHDWDNDRRESLMRQQKRQQRHEEILSQHKLFTDENFLNYRLQMEQEKNKQNMERMKEEREREERRERAREAYKRRLEAEMKRERDLTFVRTPDIFKQLLNDLNITTAELVGNGYHQGISPARSTLYPRGYLYTLLFYGVDDVVSSNNRLRAFYTDKPSEFVPITREGMNTRPKFYRLPQYKIIIVDVLGYVNPERSFISRLCPEKCYI